MPRIAEVREAAEPTSPSQKARHRRILRAAAALAAVKGLDSVQMHEVAKDAQVAIGTLYRYFPSKTYLFTAVMAEQVDWLDRHTGPPLEGQPPDETVHQVLVAASRHLLRRPALAAALIQSTNSAHADQAPEAARAEGTIRDLLLRALGAEEPSAHDVTAVWLLIQCWYGLLSSTLTGRTSLLAAEADLRVACRLLLAPDRTGHATVDLPLIGRTALPAELAG